MLGGRVKTLHPRIHGGILARRGNADDMRSLDEHGIQPIDLVVVNLYPFRRISRSPRGAARPRWSRTSTSAARRWCVPPPRTSTRWRWSSIPSATASCSTSCRAVAGSCRLRHAPRAGRRGLRAHRRLRHRDRRTGSRTPSPSPTGSCVEVGQGGRSCLRREPASAGGLLRRRGRPPPPALDGRSSSAARALLQQPAGDLNAGARWSSREFQLPACVIVKHATPVRRRARRDRGRGLPASARSDPVAAFGGVIAVNRPRERGAGEPGSPSSSTRRAVRARLRGRGAVGPAARRQNLRILDDRERRKAEPWRARLQARAGRLPGARPRHRVRGPRQRCRP